MAAIAENRTMEVADGGGTTLATTVTTNAGDAIATAMMLLQLP